jgi:hypothetical protein
MVDFTYIHLYTCSFLGGGLEGGSGAKPVSVVGCPEVIIVTQQAILWYGSYYLSHEPSTADHSLFLFFHLSSFLPFPL